MYATWIFPAGIGIAALVLLLIAALARSSRGTASPAEAAGPDAPFALRAAPWVAWGLSAVFTVTALVEVAQIWLAPSAQFRIAVAPFRPQMLPNLHASGMNPEAVVSGGLTGGAVSVSGMDVETRVWTTLSIVAWTVLFVAVALTLARLARSVRTGGGLTTGAARSFAALSVVVLIVGILVQWFSQMSAYTAARFVYGEAFLDGDWSVDEAGVIEIPFAWPRAEFAMNIDLWPVWAALALGALAAILRYGSRLQRDTEGLV